LDFGGCRCQAFLLAADAAATDPVCSLAPQRPKVDAILAALNDSNSVGAGVVPPVADPVTKPAWLYRPNPS
jgi:pyrroloquinoline quinone biosynthesis protein E